ncbi:MAG: hypothetical protein JSW15_04435, partial [Deltaproteobacteria bacterium]
FRGEFTKAWDIFIIVKSNKIGPMNNLFLMLISFITMDEKSIFTGPLLPLMMRKRKHFYPFYKVLIDPPIPSLTKPLALRESRYLV